MARDTTADDEAFRKFLYDPKKEERLKHLLEQYVEEIQNSESQYKDSAIRDLRQLIQTVTNTVTWWVPRALDFVKPYYDALDEYYQIMEAGLEVFYRAAKDANNEQYLEYHDLKKRSQQYLADILSVLALTTETPEESIKYRFLGSKGDIGSYGHGYVVYMHRELAKKLSQCQGENRSKLLNLVRPIVQYHMERSHERDKERMFILEPESDYDLGSNKPLTFRQARVKRIEKITELTKKVGIFDADLVMEDGVRVTRVYGPGFRINRAFHATEEAYRKSVELATWLARVACDYYNCQKGKDHQLIFEWLVKAIQIPVQHYYITLAAKGSDGMLKFVRAEVKYGLAVMTMSRIEFIIDDPKPFDQAYETMRLQKFVQFLNPFAVQPWEECKYVLLFVVMRNLLMAGVEVWASGLKLDVFLQTLIDSNPRLLGELHDAILRAIIEDTEDATRPLAGLRAYEGSAANAEGRSRLRQIVKEMASFYPELGVHLHTYARGSWTMDL